MGERFPAEAAEWERDQYTFAPQGGESGLAVTARALPVLIELVHAHATETILVVSHKATIRLLLSSLLGFDPRRYRDNLDLTKTGVAQHCGFQRSYGGTAGAF